MKRVDALKELETEISLLPSDLSDAEKASRVLARMEALGMKPPRVSEEDCQCIMGIYYAGYTFNQWDETLEKDEKVMDLKKRRAELSKIPFKERITRMRRMAKK